MNAADLVLVLGPKVQHYHERVISATVIAVVIGEISTHEPVELVTVFHPACLRDD
jgi:hypothetical protein